MWYIYAMEDYWAIKRNEIFIHAMTWTNPQVMLHKRKQSQKGTSV
jgi:hypothetical protein